MLLNRTRLRAVFGTALTGGIIVAGAAAASAAPVTTLTLNPSDVVLTSEALTASGVCTDGSRTAVITVTQNAAVLTEQSVTLTPSLAYSVKLDVSKGVTGLASVAVNCFRYDTAAPLGTASSEVAILDEGALNPIDVTVSPSRVTIGQDLTITGACPAGTQEAEVLAGSGDNTDPFLDEPVTPAADGTVTLTTTLKAGRLVTPGDAGALVICGSQDQPTGLGFADFTILAAPAAPATAPDPGSAVPTLARTGSDNASMTLAALALLLVGGAMTFAHRRLRQH